jgi:methyl-accepting chemotaxis protein
MQGTAEIMTTTASDASMRASTVDAASEKASGNVEMVAAAEELSASVREISQRVSQSTEVARQAVGDAERTNATVQVLSSGAEKIGEVVLLIHSIATHCRSYCYGRYIRARHRDWKQYSRYALLA